MAEKTCNAYDIMHPTPASLQHLSVIGVGLQLWRSEINEYRESRTLERFRASESDNIASLRTKLPKLPSVIYDVIDEYVARLGNSIADWLEEHSRTVSYFERYIRSFHSEVLEYFDDFVVDYNEATIDFVKTAERMMHYDDFDDVFKFIVACRYFLEDHVRRIWPSVRGKMRFRSSNFDKNPQLYYLICRLSNRFYEIPTTGRYYSTDYSTVEDKMLYACLHMPGNSLAINYFWNRVPYEDQIRMAIELFRGQKQEFFVRCILLKLNDQQLEKFVSGMGEFWIQELPLDKWHVVQLVINYLWKFMTFEMQMRIAKAVFRRNRECFASCILPKLNDLQVEKFFNEKDSELMGDLMNDFSRDEELIFHAWTCIIKAMNGSTFTNLVMNKLRTEAGYSCFSRYGHQELKKWSQRFCELWNSAPHHLKRLAIVDISSDLKLTICRQDEWVRTRASVDISCDVEFMLCRLRTRATCCEFLLSILSDFTLEERQSFWRNCWKNFMLNKNARDLQRIMEVCFEHENDGMIKFKENVIAESENLQLRCISLLSRANFDELDVLVNFSCSFSAETAKLLKQRLLQSSFIGERSEFCCTHIVHCEEFDTFINNAYGSVDLANDFKHQLVSSSNNLGRMLDRVRLPEFSYEALRKFIETFVSNEQILQLVKSSIIDHLKERAIRRSSIKDDYSERSFDQFLLWCLGSNEQLMVMEFKRTYKLTYITPYDEDDYNRK
ncbi:uncharacterized protein LOC135847456 [Planococcus citri]|uniref:uncharacterized protein LOC135847456 n=1 Tax=Planococcus citri TaxID=170843 RepID=UPI0031F7E69D